jgi:hypothetical protein
MTNKTITLDLPDTLYDRVQQIAEDSSRTPEMVLLESLNLMFEPSSGSGAEELDQLTGYSDEQLWAVVHRRLPWTQSLRLRELVAQSKQGALSSKEKDELQLLLEQVDSYMLLRSEALLLLKQRGHDITPYLK